MSGMWLRCVVIEELGYPALATSTGVANALGYADGEHTPCNEMFDWLG